MKTENYRLEHGHRLDQKITDRRAGTDWISQDKQAGKKARDTELETRPRRELDKKSQREKVGNKTAGNHRARAGARKLLDKGWSQKITA